MDAYYFFFRSLYGLGQFHIVPFHYPHEGLASKRHDITFQVGRASQKKKEMSE